MIEADVEYEPIVIPPPPSVPPDVPALAMLHTELQEHLSASASSLDVGTQEALVIQQPPSFQAEREQLQGTIHELQKFGG